MMAKFPTIDMKRTGQNIKAIMESKGFTVKYVQEYLGLGTPQSIYHWFNGRNLPTLDNLYALSELFQVSIDSIIDGNSAFKRQSKVDMNWRVFAYRKLLDKYIAS